MMQGPSRMLQTLLLVAVLLLTGCTGPDEDDTAEPTGPPAPSPSQAPAPDPTGAATPDPQAGRYVPWTLADHWRYDTTVRGVDGTTETRLIHYRESGPEYLVGVPTREEALHSAVFTTTPILGRIHKDVLSPHEDGTHAIMFPFVDGDLEDGHRWTTRFYQRFLSLEATYDPAVPGPDATGPGFTFQGSDPNDPAFEISYSYRPDVKWFTYLQVTDAEGTVVDLRLTAHGSDHSGTAHFIRSLDLFAETLVPQEPVTDTYTITVTPEHVAQHRVEGFALHADIDAEPGAVAMIRFLDPEGETLWNHTSLSGEMWIDEIFPEGARSEKPLGERPSWPAGTYTIEFVHLGAATARMIVVGTQDDAAVL